MIDVGYAKKEETINFIVNECIKRAEKEYETRNDWVGKMIPWELCKILDLDHTIKWYIHKPGSVQGNEKH